AEYPSRKGWGHGTFGSSIEAAREAGVKRVFLTHHEPTRSDEALELAFDEARKCHHVGREMDPQFDLAREGVVIEILMVSLLTTNLLSMYDLTNRRERCLPPGERKNTSIEPPWQ
ncbi:MAG: hypothetical protein AB2606_21285, partial [Candidatus Thiodiazotropha taylori]